MARLGDGADFSISRACALPVRCRAATVQAAAGRTGLKWQVVADLVARGLPSSEEGRIAADGDDAFMAGHVTGGQLARGRGTSPRALAAELASAGMMPVAGPWVDGSRLNIYSPASTLIEVANGNGTFPRTSRPAAPGTSRRA